MSINKDTQLIWEAYDTKSMSLDDIIYDAERMFSKYRGKMNHDQIIREMETYYTRKASTLDNEQEIVDYIESEGFREDLMNQLGLDHDLETSKMDRALGLEQSGRFKPSNGDHLKPIEQKIPSQEEIVDMVEYYRSEQGIEKWEKFKRYVEMSSGDWSNTMSYMMTGKGPGDYGDRLD